MKIDGRIQYNNVILYIKDDNISLDDLKSKLEMLEKFQKTLASDYKLACSIKDGVIEYLCVGNDDNVDKISIESDNRYDIVSVKISNTRIFKQLYSFMVDNNSNSPVQDFEQLLKLRNIIGNRIGIHRVIDKKENTTSERFLISFGKMDEYTVSKIGYEVKFDKNGNAVDTTFSYIKIPMCTYKLIDKIDFNTVKSIYPLTSFLEDALIFLREVYELFKDETCPITNEKCTIVDGYATFYMKSKSYHGAILLDIFGEKSKLGLRVVDAKTYGRENIRLYEAYLLTESIANRNKLYNRVCRKFRKKLERENTI